MLEQLPSTPNTSETGIINLANSERPGGIHWVAYAIDPRGIVYFDSYGLAPPVEFLKYVRGNSRVYPRTPVWYSKLPIQTLSDPPTCGLQVINVLDVISASTKPPHKVVDEYTASAFKLNDNV